MFLLENLVISQAERYCNFYGRFETLRKIFRFDIRYRCRRIHEVLRVLGISSENKTVLDFGFGSGDLLASFPENCSVCGVDVSASAVETARVNPVFNKFTNAEFYTVPEHDNDNCIHRKFDIVVSSHVIEHVDDDAVLLQALKERINDNGYLVLFAPVEEPGYIHFHVRNYSLGSLEKKVKESGLEIVFSEGSMNINGHIWKIITIPSRHNWPVLGKTVNSIRLFTLSLIPYTMVKILDKLLGMLGAGPRQAMIVARKSV